MKKNRMLGLKVDLTNCQEVEEIHSKASISSVAPLNSDQNEDRDCSIKLAEELRLKAE